MTVIMQAFTTFPKEAAAIGRLLAGYGELEFDLCLCVSNACGDFDRTLKTMFKTRGEKQRITKASDIGTPYFKKYRLAGPFASAVSDMHYCRKIRNQYAHCNWHDDYSGNLGFVVLEDIARQQKRANLRNLTIRYVDAPTLVAQLGYFAYVSARLAYLNGQAQKKAGTLESPRWLAPSKIARPPLHL